MASVLSPGIVAVAIWAVVVGLIWRHLPKPVRLRLSAAFTMPPLVTFFAALGLVLIASTVDHPELIIDPEHTYGEDEIPDDVARSSGRYQLRFIVGFLLLFLLLTPILWPII